MFNGQRFAATAQLKMRRPRSCASPRFACDKQPHLLRLLGGCRFFPRRFLWRALCCDDRFRGALASLRSTTPEGSAMDLTAPRTLITFAHKTMLLVISLRIEELI